MKKRLLSVLLCFVMVLGLLPVTAYADIPENMNTWGGKQITHVEFTAYYKGDLTADSYVKARNTLVTGEPVNPYQIQFVPTSLTWKQGANGAATNKIIAQENGDNGWRKVMTGNNVELQDMTGNRFPLYAEGAMYWRNGNWSSGAERWDRVYETTMPNYIQGDYCYRLYFEVLSQYLQKDGDPADQFRIGSNVTVTVKWLNSNRTETFKVHPGSGMGICNYRESSLFKSTAGFLSSTISVTGTGLLKMDNGGKSIASVYAGEAIKSFSVVNMVSGGTAPYTFTKVSGPDGILVDVNGTVHGAPTTADSNPPKLKIQVRDANDNTDTAEIPVNEVKTARTVIKTIELDGLYYPNGGDYPETNEARIVSIKDAAGHEISKADCHLYMSGIMSKWKEWDGQKWNWFNSVFQANKKYQYSVQFRIDDDAACTQYRMAEDMTVTAPGFSFTLGTYFDEDGYQCRYADGQEMTAGTATHLNGSILYTGAARFGVYLNAHVDNLSEGAEGSDLVWQWQYKTTNGDWMNFGNAEKKRSDTAVNLNLGENEKYLMGRLIRAVAYSTAPNFAGTIYGAPLTVEKGWNMGIPTAPVIEQGEGRNIHVTEASRNQKQEYCWTTSPSVDDNGIAVWPDDEPNISYAASTTPGMTYYFYTRFAETATMEAGRIVSAVMYTVPDPDAGTTGNPVKDVSYPNYPFGQRTIYIPVGSTETFSVDYTITPDTAISGWPVWKENHTITSADDVARLDSITAADGKLTFKLKSGAATGRTTITAYKSGGTDKWGITGTGGQVDLGRELTVIIYDADAPHDVDLLKRSLGTITLYKGDTYDLNFNYLKNNMKFVPEGVVGVTENDFTLSAELFTGTTGGFSPSDYITLNGSVITANNLTDEQLPQVNIYAIKGEGAHSVDSRIGYLKVKVVDRPALTNFVVTPSELTLNPGNTYQLRAIKTPTDNSTPVSWRSWNTSVATVDSTTGVVTAVSEGTTNVYATCGDTEVYSVVTVKAACTNGHSFYYVSVGDYGHKGICVNCGYTEDDAAAQPHDLYWYEDTNDSGNANGKMHSECPTCGYRSDPVDVPTVPQPSRPSRPSGGSSTTTEKVTSAQTGDVGIALYAMLALTSYTGTALVVRGRKRK